MVTAVVFVTIGVLTIVPLMDEISYNMKKDACENTGGTLINIQLIDEDRCVMPPEDNGQSCTDSSQCDFYCKAETGDSTEGVCIGFYESGCYFWEMEEGLTVESCVMP